ncbi:MAG: adenylate/guanylate cyclase domain-containing protein [Casimicrobiaceae bacterium]
MEPSGVKRRLTCILAADAVGYSGQMSADEEGTMRVLAAHRAVIDGIIAFHNGRILSTAGDSVLAEFSSVVEAVRCAVEIQDALKTRNDALPEHRRMLFRIGVNLGDVMVKNDDLLGDGVNVAARLEGIAEPGGICISSSVYDQITGKLDLGFLDIGEQTLKNITRPIRVFRVSGAGAPARAAPSPPIAEVRLKRFPSALVAAGAMATAAIVGWQAGWIRFGSPDAGSPKTAVVVPAPPVPIAAPAAAPPAVAEAAPTVAARAPATEASATSLRTEAERLRADALALKQQAGAELARARTDQEASRAMKSKADADVTGAKIRAQAESDAARIRADAAAAAARSKAEAELAPRIAAPETSKASPPSPKAEPAGGATTATATLPAAEKAARAAGSSSATYDGNWNVTVACTSTPDGALGYTFVFVAQVKDGLLRGEYGIEGTASSLQIQGPIQPDGSARFSARGITGDRRYSVNEVAKGTQYRYTVAATFDAARGSGKRQEMRPCDLTFVRQ